MSTLPVMAPRRVYELSWLSLVADNPSSWLVGQAVHDLALTFFATSLACRDLFYIVDMPFELETPASTRSTEAG